MNLRHLPLLLLRAALIAISGILAASCVHQWPEAPQKRAAYITLHHELPWDLIDYHWQQGASRPTRGDETGDWDTLYIFSVCREDEPEAEVMRWTELRSGTDLEDFTVAVDLPAGRYDIWVWSCHIQRPGGLSPFYDYRNAPGEITLCRPYIGDTRMKDAFQGKLNVDIRETILEEPPYEYEVTLHRPLGAYAFVATDLADFAVRERSRTGAPASEGIGPEGPMQTPALNLEGYTARVHYTGFLPWVYSVFRNRPIDSQTGISYDAPLRTLNQDEALICFDYILINGAQTSVNVAIEIFDPQGNAAATIPTLNIPLLRNRATIVRGEFLTSESTGGLGISPEFDGEFNIGL